MPVVSFGKVIALTGEVVQCPGAGAVEVHLEASVAGLTILILDGHGDVVTGGFPFQQPLADKIGGGKIKRRQQMAIDVIDREIEELHFGAEQRQIGPDLCWLYTLHDAQ